MLITIDHQKCVKDLKCVDECPVKIFNYSKSEEKITILDNPEAICINCGHCVAVCPEDAVSLKNFPSSQFMDKNKDEILTKDNLEYILRSRRSVRTYKNKIVPKEKIENLIDIASAAPTGHNSRSVNWIVIHDQEKIEKYKGMVIDWMKYMVKEQPDTAALLDLEHIIEGYESGYDGILRGAPHIIVAHASKLAPTGSIDCATAAAYLELAAPSLGLGTCWAGFFNIAATFWPPLKSELNLPKGNKNFASIMVGEPKHNYNKIIKRTPGQTTWM